jgi:tRNA pseudouridine55 synthase
MDRSRNHKTYDFIEGEVLLINKPATWTSFDVVNKIRGMIRYFLKAGKLKVGHAGTLDPLATGLLIICTGKATRNIQQYQELDKEYTGTLCLGATTPSLDKETEISEHHPVDHISEDMIREASKAFTGQLEQVPPVYSAIKIEGKRAYKMARGKQEVSMAPRQVLISSFDITGIQMPYIKFCVSCSKGTYIRSLVRDFAESLGSSAYLEALCRTRIGDFKLSDAMEITDLENILRLGQQSA